MIANEYTAKTRVPEKNPNADTGINFENPVAKNDTNVVIDVVKIAFEVRLQV